MKRIPKSQMQTLGLVALILMCAPSLIWATDMKEESAGNKMQTYCPVLGGEIDRGVYLDHAGERVYFCCEKCREAFHADPEMYLRKLKEQGVQLEMTPQPQMLCPVMGGEIDRMIYADHEGERIYFCCAPCKEHFAIDPEKYIEKMKAAGIALEKVAPEKAPRTDEELPSEQ